LHAKVYFYLSLSQSGRAELFDDLRTAFDDAGETNQFADLGNLFFTGCAVAQALY